MSLQRWRTKCHQTTCPRIVTVRTTLGSTVSHSVLASQPTPAHASARGTYIIACVMKAWWHKPPFPRWHATRGGLLAPPCFHGAGRDGRSRTKYATAGDTHTVPTPSLNYHDHTQHASFSCWLLDALVKSALPRSRVLDCSGTRWKATVLPAWGYGSAAPQQRFYVGPGVRHGHAMTTRWYQQPPPGGMPLGGKGANAAMLSRRRL